MPTITIEGPKRPLAVKRRLVARITDLVEEAYQWERSRIIVILKENPDENVARGGVLLADRRRKKTAGKGEGREEE